MLDWEHIFFLYPMKQHPILAYEEVQREVDLFLSVFSEIERQKVKSQVVHILGEHFHSEAFVWEVQDIKKQVFQMSELCIFAKLLEYSDTDVIWAYAIVFLFLLWEILKKYFHTQETIGLKENLFEELYGVNDANFSDRGDRVFRGYGDIGQQIFLREAITRKLCLRKIFHLALQKMEESHTGIFSHWEYRNISKLSELQDRLVEQEKKWEIKKESISVTLSGGNMNGIAQIGVIEALLEQGKTIDCISGSSIGGLIWTFAAFLLDPQKTPEENLATWRAFWWDLIQGIDGLSLEWNIFKIQDRKNFQMFFELLWKKYSITDVTTFSESKIPLVINGNRKYGTWLMQWQQIYMSWKDKVFESIFASVNISGKYFWETKIDNTPVEDYAAAIQLNPVEALKILGRFWENTFLVDTGSGSSDMTRSGKVEQTIRYFYTDTTRRDVMERIILEKSAWNIIAPDLRKIYDWKKFMNIGFSLDTQKIKALIEAGKRITQHSVFPQ